VRRETGHTHKHTPRTAHDTTRQEQHHKRPHEEPLPPRTYQRSKVARRRCVPPPTPNRRCEHWWSVVVDARLSALCVNCGAKKDIRVFCSNSACFGNIVNLEYVRDHVICRVNWHLQEILLLRGFCALVNTPFYPPPTCVSHTITIVLHDYCTIYDASHRPTFCMPYTIPYW